MLDIRGVYGVCIGFSDYYSSPGRNCCSCSVVRLKGWYSVLVSMDSIRSF